MHISRYAYTYFISCVTARFLFAASYDGNITTLSLTQNGTRHEPNDTTSPGGYQLQIISRTNASAPSPSWLHYDNSSKILYALNEAWGLPNGTLVSYTVSEDGKLEVLEKQAVLPGPVHLKFYNQGRTMGVAH